MGKHSARGPYEIRYKPNGGVNGGYGKVKSRIVMRPEEVVRKMRGRFMIISVRKAV